MILLSNPSETCVHKFLFFPTQSNQKSPPESFLTYLYIYHLPKPKFVPEKENSPISFLLNPPIQKQSSQFQIPLQNIFLTFLSAHALVRVE